MSTELRSYEPDTQREDEDAREQRWHLFTEHVRDALHQYGLGHVLINTALMHGDADHASTDYEQHVVNFAASEGWSSVLSVLARVVRDTEQFHGELMDRR